MLPTVKKNNNNLENNVKSNTLIKKNTKFTYLK